MHFKGLFLSLFCLLAQVSVEAWLGREFLMGPPVQFYKICYRFSGATLWGLFFNQMFLKPPSTWFCPAILSGWSVSIWSWMTNLLATESFLYLSGLKTFGCFIFSWKSCIKLILPIITIWNVTIYTFFFQKSSMRPKQAT